jgi:hypothetical protein
VTRAALLKKSFFAQAVFAAGKSDVDNALSPKITLKLEIKVETI